MGWTGHQRESSGGELKRASTGSVGALLRASSLGWLLIAGCSGSSEDQLDQGDGGDRGNTDGGNTGGLDGGGNGDGGAQGDSGNPGTGDSGQNSGDAGDPQGDAGSMVGHPTACDAPILAGDPATAQSEFGSELITGPGGPALITWYSPDRYWHARSFDGTSFGTIHHLFDNYVSDESSSVRRAVVGYGHGMFSAEIVNSTDYLRRWTVAGDSWTAADDQVGDTIAMAVRPNGDFLRISGAGTTFTLETHDPVSGDMETQPLGTFNAGIYSPSRFIIDSQDDGVFVIPTSMTLNVVLIRDGQVAASGTRSETKTFLAVDAVFLADGRTAVVWQTEDGISSAYASDSDQNGVIEWSDPVSIYVGSGGNVRVVGTPEGELTVTWANGDTYARRYVNGTWGDVETVLDRSGGSSGMSIAISESGTVAILSTPSGDSTGYLNTVLKGEHTWSQLDVTSSAPGDPSIAFNAAGEPYFIWSSRKGSTSEKEITLTTCR